MGKSRAIYEPGELDRVRKNLGEVDPEEARHMAKVLGGEVGYEKDPEALAREEKQRKVAQAAEEARRQAYEARVRERRRKAAAERKLAKTAVDSYAAEDRGFRRLPYSAQLRMDFRCAHADHLIKTQSQALLSVFRFLPGYRDPINPYFVRTLCSQACDRVEKLVQAARFILPSKRVDLWARLREFPLQYAVMDCLAGWNLDGVSEALAILQGNPKEISVDQLRILAVLVFKPLFRLKEAYAGTALKGALAAATSLASDAEPGNRRSYVEAREEALDEADYLFGELFYAWYPLLMRYCAFAFHEHADFYDSCRPALLRFLGLQESDIIRDSGVKPFPKAGNEETPPEPEAGAEASAEAQAEGSEPDLEVVRADGAAGQAEAAKPGTVAGAEKPPKVVLGLELMDKLFPEAGWKKPEDSPDLYPYFNQIYPLPRGTDLIAPADPLIQIICMNQALNDLLHGFRSMSFGISKDGDSLDLNQSINDILNDWTQPIDEVVAKAYLPLLSEYCRLIETERESQNSAYAAKREADLLWYKKRFFLPHLSGTALSSVQNPRDKEIKAMHKQARTLKGYLSMIAQDIDRAVKARKEMAAGNVTSQSLSCSTIDNPFDPASFEVENVVSRRLRLILKHEGPVPKRLTNAALIYYAVTILEAFDFLLNDQRSWAYRERRGLPYRSLSGDDQLHGGEAADVEKAFSREIEAFDKERQAGDSLKAGEPRKADEPRPAQEPPPAQEPGQTGPTE